MKKFSYIRKIVDQVSSKKEIHISRQHSNENHKNQHYMLRVRWLFLSVVISPSVGGIGKVPSSGGWLYRMLLVVYNTLQMDTKAST